MSEREDLAVVYRDYLSAFNVGDFETLERYLAPDLVFDWGGHMPTMRSRAEMFAFYREAWTYFEETVTASDVEVDGDRLYATVSTELRIFRDWPDCPLGPMRVGPFSVAGPMAYRFENGRIVHIADR